MASKFLPVKLENVEEGNFLKDAEAEFRNLQEAIIQRVRKFSDKEKVKAELTLKVVVVSKEDMYAIETSIAKKIPGRPKSVTAALAEESADGKGFILFAQSGTSKGSPRQKKFAAQDGRTIKDDGSFEGDDYETES